jgi:hypothetical protein
MNGTAVTNRLQNSFKITCTDHPIIEILGLRPSNRLPVSYCMYRQHILVHLTHKNIPVKHDLLLLVCNIGFKEKDKNLKS